MSTAELLEQWREAVRASELAARLARMAAESVERTAREADAAEELAKLAERAADAASEAAVTARRAAQLAAEVAQQSVTDQRRDDDASTAAQAVEDEARDRYHQAEQAARARTDESRTSGSERRVANVPVAARDLGLLAELPPELRFVGQSVVSLPIGFGSGVLAFPTLGDLVRAAGRLVHARERAPHRRVERLGRPAVIGRRCAGRVLERPACAT